MSRTSIALIVVLLAGLQGCSRLSTEYGESRGITGRTSLNGFAALRTAFERAGFRSRDVTRLSDRVRRSEVIVWTPQVLGPVDDNVTKWFDEWLRQGSRTLVYIPPDSGSEADYWMDATKLAPPELRLEYRKRAGQAINQRMQWRINRTPIPSNGWFLIEPKEVARSVRPNAGRWLTDQQLTDPALADPSLTGAATSKDDADVLRDAEFPAIELSLRPYQSSGSQPSTGSTATPVTFTPTGPATSIWQSDVTTSVGDVEVEYVPLLSIDDQGDLVAEIRSNQWQNSKIVVVAGGSLLTNYAFTRPANQQIADRIIVEAKPIGIDQPVVGFLTSASGSVPVSERTADALQSTGMEFLTEWPISMVTMHGVVLGLIVCLMLIPIFGRPRRLRQLAANSFAHHLDAVAALMSRAKGEDYARERISEYRRRMHGETSGPWVLPDRDPPVPPPQSKLGSAQTRRYPESRPSR